MFRYRVYGLCLGVNRPIPQLEVTAPCTSIDIQIELAGTQPFPVPLTPEPSQSTPRRPNPNSALNPTTTPLVAADGSRYLSVRFEGTHSLIEFIINRQATEVWATWTERVRFDDVVALLLRPIFARVMWLRSITALHASAVQVNERAIVLVGASGAGKSTTAGVFAQRGHSILTDDIAALHDGGNHFLVQPAAPALWLLPNAAAELMGSAEQLPPIWKHEEKRHVELHTRAFPAAWQFEQLPVTLAAVYILGARQPASTEPMIVPLPSAAALLALVANAYGASVLDKTRRGSQFDLFSRMVQSVPVRRVRCPDNLAALPRVYDAIMDDLARSKSASSELPKIVT